MTILSIAAECRRRRATGETIIDLSVGELDFDTPSHIAEAAVKAIRDGQTRYTPPQGLAQLRSAAVRALAQDKLRFAPKEVMITCGATGAIFCALQALLQGGDEVILSAPWYAQYLPSIQQVGAKPVIVQTTRATNWKMTPDALRDAITPRTRLIILNSPANPTGAVYTRGELEALAAVSRDIQILSDEVYSAFTYETEFTSIAAIDASRTLVVRSVSKTYAMTGWRVGFAAGPAQLIERMTAIQEACIVTPSTPSQWAALEALRGPQDCVDEFRNALAERRGIANLRFGASGDGGMFVFPDLREHVDDVDAFCDSLLRHHGVAVVPGSEFGAPTCIRMSLGAPAAHIREALTRIGRAIESEPLWISA